MISTLIEGAIDGNRFTVASGSSHRDFHTVDILVTDAGYQMDGNPVGRLELENELNRFGAMADPPVLAIRANADTPYQNVVTLLDLLKQNQLKRINLITRPEE